MSRLISILKLYRYDGKHTTCENMYFETDEGAIKWLKENEYHSDEICEWKKEWGKTAKIKHEPLH